MSGTMSQQIQPLGTIGFYELKDFINPFSDLTNAGYDVDPHGYFKYSDGTYHIADFPQFTKFISLGNGTWVKSNGPDYSEDLLRNLASTPSSGDMLQLSFSPTRYIPTAKNLSFKEYNGEAYTILELVGPPYIGGLDYSKVPQQPGPTPLPPPVAKDTTEKTGVWLALDDGYRHEIIHYLGDGPDDPFNHDPFNYFIPMTDGKKMFFPAVEFKWLEANKQNTYLHNHDQMVDGSDFNHNVFVDQDGSNQKFYITSEGKRQDFDDMSVIQNTASKITPLTKLQDTATLIPPPGSVLQPGQTIDKNGKTLPIYKDGSGTYDDKGQTKYYNGTGYLYWVDPKTGENGWLRKHADSKRLPPSWTGAPAKKDTSVPWTKLNPSTTFQPLIPLNPSNKYQPLIPLTPSYYTGPNTGNKGDIPNNQQPDHVRPTPSSMQRPSQVSNMSAGDNMPKAAKRGRKGGVGGGRMTSSPYVDVGMDYTTKPMENKNVPANAQCTLINFISDQVKDLPTIATGKEWIGEVFEYEFPSVDLQKNITQTTEFTMMPVEEIFDVDLEFEAKTDLLHNFNGSIDGYFARNGDGSFANTKQGSPATSTVKDVISTNKAAMADLLTDPKPMMLYVISKSKQKVLGDYIQQNLVGAGGVMKEMTARQFDEFCYTVKPLYACHFTPVFNVKTNRHLMGTADPATGREVPEATAPQGFTWHCREFHYNLNKPQVTTSDTYASRLLIGSYSTGACFGKFYAMTLRIYHRLTHVQYQTLFFMNQNMTAPNSYAGDRHKMGNPATTGIIGDKLVGDFDKISMTITCQHGKIGLVNDGTAKNAGSPTNILQDTAQEGFWY